jgi:hypothetical protein
MAWKDEANFINDQCFDPDNGFGDKFVYTSNHGLGTPVIITAIRVRRSPDEFNPDGAFEGIEIRESDFSALPVPGDLVTVDAVAYVISSLRNPDTANGTVVLLLNRRVRA